MSVARVIETSAESDTSFEDAIQQGILSLSSRIMIRRKEADPILSWAACLRVDLSSPSLRRGV